MSNTASEPVTPAPLTTGDVVVIHGQYRRYYGRVAATYSHSVSVRFFDDVLNQMRTLSFDARRVELLAEAETAKAVANAVAA